MTDTQDLADLSEQERDALAQTGAQRRLQTRRQVARQRHALKLVIELGMRDELNRRLPEWARYQ